MPCDLQRSVKTLPAAHTTVAGVSEQVDAPPQPIPEHTHAPRADLCERWRELCSRFLPVAADNSVWRFSRRASADAPEQGWKLHVSATLLTACEVLEKIAPLLHSRDTLFKAPASLLEIHKINSGLHYGYQQVGKVLTVYPASPQEAFRLARRLYESTRHLSAPVVPYDGRFRPDGCVYYRYGAFSPLEIINHDGTRTPAIRHPSGHLVPDLRVSACHPEWVTNPFTEPPSPREHDDSHENPLQTTYRAFRALTQRGRGGVYEAVDAGSSPPRLCILKEGRREGEIAWDGRDGVSRVKNEERVLRSLAAAGVNAPRVYASFEVEGNYYLVSEFIAGETVESSLSRRRRRLSLKHGLGLGGRLALLLARIHAAGWVWRDFKPSNVMLTKEGELRPLDFEGACPLAHPDPLPWVTPGFTPPAGRRPAAGSIVYEDLYALGATLYLLLTGELPASPAPTPLGRLRRNTPPDVCRLVEALLIADPDRQPAAGDVARRLLAD
ncbi:MAG TPA: phosphotransferase [Pyrinomonadaceae bacterium]|nr:phosphotransferase [Pyrinomonadaceae bacterium]